MNVLWKCDVMSTGIYRQFEGCIYFQCQDSPRMSLGHAFIFSLKHSPWTWRDPEDDNIKAFENSKTI